MASTERSAILLLEDGSVYHGTSVGAEGTTYGEICFNTSMTGYQEVFTDPSYYGQILVETNVHIGNYGAWVEDNESSGVKIAGLVCRNFTDRYSRPLADSSLRDYFLENNLIAISGLDTRSIVKKIRVKGAMNALICTDGTPVDLLKESLDRAPKMEGLELASRVSRNEGELLSGCEEGDLAVAVMDYGVKNSILENFKNRGCKVRIFPAKTSFEDVMKWNPQGIFLSNGPGDPASMPYAVDFARQALDSGIPIFGICLGHQVLALALGLETYKLHHGHRGSNHPVINLETGLCEVTAQNHGFGVKAESFSSRPDLMVTHRNLNDDTVEGMKVLGKPIMSVQYHPEASPGPHDSRYLFDQYITYLK